jgi:hypothetical protein
MEVNTVSNIHLPRLTESRWTRQITLLLIIAALSLLALLVLLTLAGAGYAASNAPPGLNVADASLHSSLSTSIPIHRQTAAGGDLNYLGEGSLATSTPVTGTICVLAFNDLNGNGRRDPNEPLLAGATITVTNNASGAVVGVYTTTGNVGDEPHCFPPLDLGTYRVEEQNPADYRSTTPDIWTLFLNPGTTLTVAFGDERKPTPTPTDTPQPTPTPTDTPQPTPTPTATPPTGTIRVLVYKDVDGNGRRDQGEGLLADATITVTGPSGVFVYRTDGVHEPHDFTGLASGVYQVDEQNPPGYRSTTSDTWAVPIVAGAVVPIDFGDQAVPTATPTGTRLPTVTPTRTITPTVTFTPTPTSTPTATPAPGTICVLVYEDVNGNKMRDAGEPLLAGAKITVTNSSGLVSFLYTTDGVHEPYNFAGLAADTYLVEEHNPDGYPDNTTQDSVLVLLLPGSTPCVQFGDRAKPKDTPTPTNTRTPTSTNTPTPTATATPTATPTTGTIRVLVYEDANGNGRRDEGERCLPGAVITLRDANGNVIATYTTDGIHEPHDFAGLAPGPDPYKVYEQNPPGYPISTTPDSWAVLIAAGTVVSINFGDQALKPPDTPTPTWTPTPTPTTGAIRVRVFNDLNGNGWRDCCDWWGKPTEPLLAGATITVTNSISGVVCVYPTDGIKEWYKCDDLDPALSPYHVEEQNPPDYRSTTPDGWDGDVKANTIVSIDFGDQFVPTPTPTPTITPTPLPTSTPTATPVPGTICVLAFNDKNGNHQRDSGEILLSGAAITVTNSSGSAVDVYTTDGVHEPHCKSGLAPDTYRLEEKNPAGYPSSTTPDSLLVALSAGSIITVPFGDQVPPTYTPTPTNTRTPTITRTPTPSTPTKTPTITRTSTPRTPTPAPGAIYVLVFNDKNGNGQRDKDYWGNWSELLLAGATITVSGPSGVFTYTTDGVHEPYCFPPLVSGHYQVVEQNPANYFSTTQDTWNVVLLPGSTADVQFGDQARPTDTPTPTCTYTPRPTSTPTATPAVGIICALAFHDLNGNGQRGLEDPLLAGATITVTKASRAVIGVYTTDGVREPHCFTGLAPGVYRTEEQSPAGYRSTTPNIWAVSLAPGITVTVGFGDQALPTATPTGTRLPTATPATGAICALAFEDPNGNGLRDLGDLLLDGVKITVTNASGLVVCVYDTLGVAEPYCCPPLATGSYLVVAQLPAGYRFTTPESRTVRLDPGTRITVGFGAQLIPTATPTGTPPPTATPTATPAPGAICALAFNDLNGNGQRDSGESLLAGATITLTNSRNVAVGVYTTTGVLEPYCFNGLAPDTYRVEEQNPTGYSSTTPSVWTVSIFWDGVVTVPFGNQAQSITSTNTRLQIPVIQTMEGWETWIQVQNVGVGPSKAVMLLWSESSGSCAPQCAPKKLEVTKLIQPGATLTWILTGNISTCAGGDFAPRSGIIYSVKPYHEPTECNPAWRPAPDDIGQPLAVSITRIQTGSGGQTVRAADYVGISATMEGQRNPRTGAYTYYVPQLFDKFSLSGWSSKVWIQNSGDECTSLEVWFHKQQDCLKANAQEVLALCPGETIAVTPSSPGFVGSAWIRATQPLGVIVDATNANDSILMSYQGLPANYWLDSPSGALLNYAPLVYREYNGWNAGIQVQNLSNVHNALVKVYFLDNSGDLITTMTDWVCPRGSQSFYLPAINDLPGQYLGQVLVESQNWWSPGDPPLDTPYIQTVVNLVNDSVGQGLAYNALPAPWGGGGWQVLGLPKLVKKHPVPGLTSVVGDSEIAVTNLNPKPNVTVFRLDFFDQNGLLYSLCRTINEKQVEHVNLGPVGIIPPGWLGSAVISVQCGPGGLGAVVVEQGSGQASGDLAAGYEALPLPSELLELYRDRRLFISCPSCP